MGNRPLSLMLLTETISNSLSSTSIEEWRTKEADVSTYLRCTDGRNMIMIVHEPVAEWKYARAWVYHRPKLSLTPRTIVYRARQTSESGPPRKIKCPQHRHFGFLNFGRISHLNRSTYCVRIEENQHTDTSYHLVGGVVAVLIVFTLSTLVWLGLMGVVRVYRSKSSLVGWQWLRYCWVVNRRRQTRDFQ